jgi:hypothetical protein
MQMQPTHHHCQGVPRSNPVILVVGSNLVHVVQLLSRAVRCVTRALLTNTRARGHPRHGLSHRRLYG